MKRFLLALFFVTIAGAGGFVGVAYLATMDSSAERSELVQVAPQASACESCHGPSGVSASPIPILAGQRREYLEAAIRAYRDGLRNDPAMSAAVSQLTDTAIVLLAAYFAAQPGGVGK